MALDYLICEELLESGWMIDTQGDDVPLHAVFTYVLKEGAPEDIKKKFLQWKDAFEWEAEHLKHF